MGASIDTRAGMKGVGVVRRSWEECLVWASSHLLLGVEVHRFRCLVVDSE